MPLQSKITKIKFQNKKSVRTECVLVGATKNGTAMKVPLALKRKIVKH